MINLYLTALAILSVYIYAITIIDTGGFAWYAYIWINLELILCLNVALGIYQSGLFFTMFTIVGSFAYCGHLIQTNQKTLKLMKECRLKSPKCPIVPWKNRSIIADQLYEHNQVTYLVISGGRQMFGYILYSFILTNIQINVYMISRIIFEEHEIIDKIMSWIMVFFQLLICIIAFGPLAYGAKVGHSPAKFIPTLQPMFHGRPSWLWFKMKYEDLYHRLVDDGPKIAISIGPLSPITYRNSFEVSKLILC